MCFFIFGFLLVVSTVCLDHYRAAIAQFQHTSPVSDYLLLIREASVGKAEIIVFPELGVSERYMREKIDVGSCPCSNVEKPIQSNISCMTRESFIYVVFDMEEEGELCEPEQKYCDKTLGYFVYNTAIVMDRFGCIITKYRKHNPYVDRFKPGPPVVSTFISDFGVTFGLFICFDILWKVPAGDVVRENRINNILFPTRWVDTLFIDGSQIQQGYSQYFQTNLLAANSVMTSEGSGIFSRGLPLVVNDSIVTKLMFADVPYFGFIDPPSPGATKKMNFTEDSIFQVFEASPGLEGVIHAKLESHTCDFRFKVKEGTESLSVGAIDLLTHTVKQQSCYFTNCGYEKKPPYEVCENDNPATVFEYLEINMTVIDDIRMVLPLVSGAGKQPVKEFDKLLFVHNENHHSIVLDHVEEPVSFVVHFGVVNDEA